MKNDMNAIMNTADGKAYKGSMPSTSGSWPMNGAAAARSASIDTSTPPPGHARAAMKCPIMPVSSTPMPVAWSRPSRKICRARANATGLSPSRRCTSM